MNRSCSCASSIRWRRRSSESVRPLGFWKVGFVYRNAGRRAVAEVALEHLRVEPLVVQRDRDDLGAQPREDLQRPVVRRRLDEHAVAGPDELVGEEAEALERARRHDHARGLDAVAGGDPLAQRPVAAAGPVREHGAAVALDHGAGAVGHLGDRQALGRGHAARKGDDIHEAQSRDRGRRLSARIRSATSCGHLGRRRADLDAARLERVLLRLRGAGGAGDDRAGVAHRLAGRRREAGDVGEDRLRHVLGDELGRLLLLVAADLADHHDQLRLRVVLELREHVDERGADDGVAADADDRRVAEAELRQLVADLVGQRAGARDEPDGALAEDLGRDDADVRLARARARRGSSGRSSSRPSGGSTCTRAASRARARAR